MQKSQIKIPKIHLQINLFLWVLLVVIMLAELFLLYKYLYLLPKKQIPDASIVPLPSLSIDFDASDRTAKWFEDQATYELPGYALDLGAVGRDNPFAQY